MAQESCNLDKEEPEILKPSSPSNPSTSQSTTAAISNPLSAAGGGIATAAAPASLCSKPPQELSAQKAERPERPETSVEASCRLKSEKESRPPFQYGNRCTSCKRKVGLTGFRCRCGDLFCSRHRYSETHDCSFDYKALGREEISKANPVVRAAKIIKI